MTTVKSVNKGSMCIVHVLYNTPPTSPLLFLVLAFFRQAVQTSYCSFRFQDLLVNVYKTSPDLQHESLQGVSAEGGRM